MDDITFGSEHVCGQRLFVVDRNSLTLKSLNDKYTWIPGVNTSVCNYAGHGHPDVKPTEQCTCGFWTCKSRKKLRDLFKVGNLNMNFFGPRPQLYVSAQVEQWGIVIEHENGYRSEFARIIPGTIQLYPRPIKPHHVKLIQKLREVYTA